MRIHRDLERLRAGEFRNPYATIGVFDGVHLGHQHLIAELREWAGGGGECVAITFRDHPLTVLGQIPPAIITSLEHRLVLLERTGLDGAVVLDFDREMAAWPPERFVREVLVERLGSRRLLMGFDSAFGKGAVGTGDYLRARPDLGVEVRSARAFPIDGKTVSSTDVRAAILKGELDTATRLLGRRPSIYGEVIHGDGRGRSLGFPTANLNLFHSAAPPHGVYIAEVIRLEPRPDAAGRGAWSPRPALVNIGRRPTFLGPDVPLDYSRYFNEQLDKVEIYIHDFEAEIYGSAIEAVLHRKLRDERRFPSSTALVEQIEQDRDALLRWAEMRRGH